MYCTGAKAVNEHLSCDKKKMSQGNSEIYMMKGFQDNTFKRYRSRKKKEKLQSKSHLLINIPYELR